MAIFARIHPLSLWELNIMSVCRTWRRLIINTPEFWADLLATPTVLWKLQCKDERLQTYLMRSRPKPLRFPDTTFTSTTQYSFTSTSISHIDRITFINITVPRSCLASLERMIACGMAQLETLATYRLLRQGSLTKGVMDSSHIDTLPRLRSLAVPVSLVDAPIPAPSVEALTITANTCCSHCRRKATIRAYLVLLRHYPLLQYLEIAEEIQREESMDDENAVLLSRLQQLNLHWSSASVVSIFMTCLLLPPEAVLHIEAIPDESCIIPDPFKALPILPRVTGIRLSLLDEVTIRVKGFVAQSLQFSLAIRDPQMFGGQANSGRALGELLVLVASAAEVTSLTVQVSWITPFSATTLSGLLEILLRCSPGLTELATQLDASSACWLQTSQASDTDHKRSCSLISNG